MEGLLKLLKCRLRAASCGPADSQSLWLWCCCCPERLPADNKSWGGSQGGEVGGGCRYNEPSVTAMCSPLYLRAERCLHFLSQKNQFPVNPVGFHTHTHTPAAHVQLSRESGGTWTPHRSCSSNVSLWVGRNDLMFSSEIKLLIEKIYNVNIR